MHQTQLFSFRAIFGRACFLCGRFRCLGTFSREPHWDYSHNLVSESSEQSTFKRLGSEISDHIPCGAPIHRQLTLLDAVGNKEKANVNMLRALAARSLAILFEKYGTVVVLVKEILLDLIALSFNKIPCPTDQRVRV